MVAQKTEVLATESKRWETFHNAALRTHPYITAGDVNIDLVQCATQAGSRDDLDTATTNNFMPLLMVHIHVTSKSSTLVDHIY